MTRNHISETNSMPCNSDYLTATPKEKHLSRVACLLDELDGKSVIDRNHWDGYHPAVYEKTVNGCEMVAKLCRRLQSVDVTKFSFEMQIWWRDHKKADQERLQAEIAKTKSAKEKQAALAKLTAYERRLLGLSK